MLSYDTGGFKVDFTLTSANAYSLTMTNLDPNAAVDNRSITVAGTLAGTSDAGIDSVTLYSQQNTTDAYHNMYFNNMVIIPEPASDALVCVESVITVLIGAACGSGWTVMVELRYILAPENGD